ncbi:NusA-like transcription termination signal-binding factor [Candidatus Woesearchaeota archaeon]|nr:NusA-like transcription termination signal-binding factor [Candidatus Woesearchaeota archaeon]
MVILTKEALEYIKLFTAMTKADVRNCFLDNSTITFIVEKHQAGKAVGKNGINVRRLSGMFRKSIKVIEFNDDKAIFLRNIMFPLIPKDVIVEGNKIKIISTDNIQKGRIFGREKINLKRIKDVFNGDYKDYEIIVE